MSFPLRPFGSRFAAAVKPLCLSAAFLLAACGGPSSTDSSSVGASAADTGGSAINSGSGTDTTNTNTGSSGGTTSGGTSSGGTSSGGTTTGGTTSNPTVLSGDAVYTATVARLTNVGTARYTYYVATDGSDSNDGRSLTKPFKTLEHAIAVVGAGDTIMMRAGTYTPTVENGFFIRGGGQANARIKLKPYNSEKVVLSAGSHDFVMYLFESAPYWILEGLEFSGGGANGYTLKIDAPNVNLVNSNLHGSYLDTVKLVQTSNDVVIYGNEIHHPNAAASANAQGVDIVGADRVWLAHNYVHDIQSIGMYAKGNSRNIIFENNRVENVTSRGIMLGQSTDSYLLDDGIYETYDGIIRNNVIVNTDDACLATASSINVKIYNNSCYNVAKTYHGAIFVSNESTISTPGKNIEIKNNIIVGTTRPVVKIGPGAVASTADLHIDRNIYWNGGAAVTFLSEDNSLFSVDISTWRSRMGQDATSIVADPKYSSVSTLQLLDSSPAIDAGVTTSVVTDDYRHTARPLGAAYDIGAYEMK